MRERAAHIDAQLDVWSEAGAGTEVELRVPSAVAYHTPGGGRGRFRVLDGQGGGS